MSRMIRILKYFLIFLLIASFTACASTRKNTYLQKRRKTSWVNTSQLGRNKYFFSSGYQKKLVKSYKRK